MARARLASIDPFGDAGAQLDQGVMRPYAAKLASMIAIREHSGQLATGSSWKSDVRGLYVNQVELSHAIDQWNAELTSGTTGRGAIKMRNVDGVTMNRVTIRGFDNALDMENVQGFQGKDLDFRK